MQVGVFYFPADYGIDPGELAAALEARGFASLYVPEHTHIPTSRRTPFPGGGELPKKYSHTHDPFVALSFAAAATKKLLLGTGICLIPERDPIVTAKSVASLDQLSGGRFIFGIGGGWNVEEMENHGAQYETRFRLMRERILAMKALWNEEEAAFHGEFVNFDPVWSYPKPKQRPHPPILLGGETDYTLRRIVEYCDGWIPRPVAGFTPRDAKARLARMAEVEGPRPGRIVDHSVPRPARQGGARRLSCCRDRRGTARNPRSRPRRDPAAARQVRTADPSGLKGSHMIREELVFVATCDISGHVRGKGFPARELPGRLKKGIGWTGSNLMMSPAGPIWDTPFGTAGDFMIVPDPAAEVRVDFADGSAVEHFFLGDICTTDGKPWECCPRDFLHRARGGAGRGRRGCGLWRRSSRNLSTPVAIDRPGDAYALGAFRRQGNFGETFIAALRAAGAMPGQLSRRIRCSPIRSHGRAAAGADRGRPCGDHPRDGACDGPSPWPPRDVLARSPTPRASAAVFTFI